MEVVLVVMSINAYVNQVSRIYIHPYPYPYPHQIHIHISIHANKHQSHNHNMTITHNNQDRKGKLVTINKLHPPIIQLQPRRTLTLPVTMPRTLSHSLLTLILPLTRLLLRTRIRLKARNRRKLIQLLRKIRHKMIEPEMRKCRNPSRREIR